MDSDQKWAWQPSSHDAAGSERSQPDFLLDTDAGARPVYTRALAIDNVWNADELLTAFGGIQPAGPSPLVSAIVLHMDGKIEEALAELEAGIAAGWRGLDILTARNQLLYTLGRYEAALAGYEEVRQRDPERAGNAFHRGVCLERLGRYAEAYDAFGEALGRNASDAEALRARGIVELHLERYADALKTFEDCLRQTDDPALLFGKALALQHLGRPREAEGVYREFLKKQPACDDALVNLIVMSVEGRQEESVLRYSGLLLKARADSGPALETLAGIELAAENYEAAASLCSRVVQRTPDSYEGWFNLGVACHATQHLEQAVEAFTAAARLRPEAVEAHLALAAAHQDAGQLAEARQSYETALAIHPDEPFAMLQLAIAEERSGVAEAAEARFGDYVRRFPESEEAWFRLGQLRMARGEMAGAVECFETCVGLRPHWPRAQYNLAVAAWQSGDVERAEPLLKSAVEAQPDFVEAVDALAQIAMARNDPAAVELLERLVELGDRSAETCYNLALLLQNERRWEEAISFYREALKERPNLVEALERLGQVHLRLGMQEEARTYFRRARETNLELLERQQKAV